MRVADTSALYALSSETDVHHEDAREAVAMPDPIVVPLEILGETLGLIQHRQGFEAAWEAGVFLRALPHVVATTTVGWIAETAWEMFEDASGDLSYHDAIVVAWCRSEGSPPLTFDEAIAERAPGS